MKNLNKFIIAYILFVIPLVGGCTDQLLNPTPKSILTESNTYNRAKDIGAAVLGIYSTLKTKVETDYLLKEVPSDNAYGFYYAVHPGLSEVENLEVSVDNEIVHNFWKHSYNAILRANKVLSNIDNPSDYLGSQKEKFIGEAKFLRALYYFDLVRIYGDIPLVLEEVSVEEAGNVARTPKDQVVDKIIEDLEDAISKLPSPSDIEVGKASNAAAASLLGKVYIYKKDWENAVSYLGQVINDYNYSLASNYSDLFRLQTEDNSETILSVPFVEGIDGQELSTQFAPHPGIYGVISGGRREIRPTWDLHKMYDDEDTRFPVTILEEYLPFNGTPGDELIYQPMINKYLVPHTRGSSGLDIPMIRLGDIVLLYSEALYKTGQPEEALNQLNLIRERAFGSNDHNYQLNDFSDEESFMDLLLKERRLELAFENKRWFDLVRTGRFTRVLTEFETEYAGGGKPEVVNLNPQPYMRHFPIPHEQIQLAGEGVLSQNEGY